MPLPRKKDEGGAKAPVLDILTARVRLTEVEEKSEPYTVTRKADGATFTLDPGFNCRVEILDDGDDGSDNGAVFFEQFRYKQDKNGAWFNNSNSKLGKLTEVVKPGYFEDTSIADLTEDDLEDFEMLCRIKPKKNPQSGQIVGSTIDWETMRPARDGGGKPERATVPDDGDGGVREVSEEDFDDLPF